MHLYRFSIPILFLIASFGTVANGQQVVKDQQVDDAEFGNIPDSLFEMKPSDEDASHQIANKELDISFQETDDSIVAVLQYHVRLKIFDDEDPEASMVTIPYYFENDMEQIVSIEGYTHLPSGKQIPLQEQAIRTININSRYNVKEFAMPEVEEGAVLEYRYEIQRRYIEELPEFFLSHEVPTSNAKVEITYPKYLRYQAHVENYDGHLINDIVYTDTSSVPKIFTVPQPPPVVTERWIARDISAVTEEAFISSLDDYRAKIQFMLSEFGNPRQQLENSWQVVVARMREKTNPWQQINQNKLAEAKGDSIASSLDGESQEVVQDSIFHYLNQQVNFSGSHSPFSTEGDRYIFDGQSADQAAINQTLIAMLRGAGIEADPVLTATREAGKINMDFPSFYQFNGQVVRSNISGQYYFMDASFPFSYPDLIPSDIYGSRGIVFKQNSYEWISIEPAESKFELEVNIDAQLHPDGTIEGEVDATNRGYPAQLIRRQKADGSSNTEVLQQTLFDGYPQITIEDVSLDNVENIGEPVEVSGRFEIPSYATSFTDGLKYPPMIVGYRSENPFDEDSRQFPITLDSPEKLDVSYSIALPSGYSVEQGLRNESLNFVGAQFREEYDMQQNKLNYGYEIDISQKEFSADYFPQLYNLYKHWTDLSNTAWLIQE